MIRKITLRKFFNDEGMVLIPLILLLTNLFGVIAYWKLLFIASVLIIALVNKIKLVDIPFIFILIYLSTYLIFLLSYNRDLEISVWSSATLVLLPLSFYIFGIYIADKYKSSRGIYFVIIIIIISISIIPFLSNVLDVLKNGFMNNRSISIIWSNTEGGLMNATNVAGRMCLCMSLFGLLFVTASNDFEKKIRKIALVLFFIGLFSIANVSSRTGLFISVLSLFVIMIDKKFSRTTLRLVIAALFTVSIMYYLGAFEWIKTSFLYHRFADEMADASLEDTSTLPRVFRWGRLISGLFEYPLGGKIVRFEGNYAHNLWLDVGWRFGIIPVIQLLFVTGIYIKYLGAVLKNKYYSSFFRALVFTTGIGLLLTFMVEPIMEGYFIVFCIWIFFIGYCKSLAKIEKKELAKNFLINYWIRKISISQKQHQLATRKHSI